MTAITPTALKVVRVADLGQEEVLTSAHNDDRQGLVHFINPTGFATLAQADSEVNIGLRDDEGVVIGVASTKPRTYLDNEGVTLLRDADIFLGDGVLDSLAVGAPIFLSATVPGGLDDAAPVDESHIPVQVGYVVAAWRESGYDKLMRVDTLTTANVLTWAGGGVIEFTDDFSSLKAGWSANLSVSGGQAIVTPTLTPVLTETFDSWSGTEPEDLPDGWAATLSPGEREFTQRNPGEFNADAPGTGAANYYLGVTSNHIVTYSGAVPSAGDWYQIAGSMATNAGALSYLIGGITALEVSGAFINLNRSSVYGVLALGTTFSFRQNSGSPVDWTIDSLVFNRVDDFAAVRDLEFTQGYIEATLQLDLCNAGIIHYVDDDNYVVVVGKTDSNAANARWYLVKKVAGTVTVLAEFGNLAKGAGLLRLARSGNDYTVTLNGSTLGTATAVNDAVFETCTTWGLFTTHADNRFDNVVAEGS